MQTAKIEISENVKFFLKQFNMTKENVLSLAKQHNVKTETEDWDNEGNKFLKCKIKIGLIEITLKSEPFL